MVAEQLCIAVVVVVVVVVFVVVVVAVAGPSAVIRRFGIVFLVGDTDFESPKCPPRKGYKPFAAEGEMNIADGSSAVVVGRTVEQIVSPQ